MGQEEESEVTTEEEEMESSRDTSANNPQPESITEEVHDVSLVSLKIRCDVITAKKAYFRNPF